MKRVSRLFKAANAARLKVYLLALWKLWQHPETPRAVRWVAVAVLAYALSPIDLIPDFIPVLGLLDDLILLPLGVALVVKLTPAPLWQARLREAEASGERVPKMLWGVLLIAAVWLLCGGLLAWWAWRTWGAP